jgi:hypothetical protein
MIFLIGVLVNGPSPKAKTAAQKPILATVRAKSSAEKFVRVPTKFAPGYSLLASSKVGPQR